MDIVYGRYTFTWRLIPRTAFHLCRSTPAYCLYGLILRLCIPQVLRLLLNYRSTPYALVLLLLLWDNSFLYLSSFLCPLVPHVVVVILLHACYWLDFLLCSCVLPRIIALFRLLFIHDVSAWLLIPRTGFLRFFRYDVSVLCLLLMLYRLCFRYWIISIILSEGVCCHLASGL